MDLAWADAYPGQDRALGEIFTLVFVKDVDEVEALRRMGGLLGSMATRTLPDIGELHTYDHGYPTVASAVQLDGWTVVFEPEGFESSHLVTAMSLGTEAISVLRHDYASPSFGYAQDGELITGFDPSRPGDRYGADPDRLLPGLSEAGLATSQFDRTTSRSLRLTQQLTGTLPTFEMLTAPLTSAEFEPWFSQTPRRHDDPVAEVRRIAAQHRLTDTPGLSEALTAAEQGTPPTVTPNSTLGVHVREWLTVGRQASWSLNDHSGRYRMDDTARRRGYDLTRLANALGAAVLPGPEPA